LGLKLRLILDPGAIEALSKKGGPINEIKKVNPINITKVSSNNI